MDRQALIEELKEWLLKEMLFGEFVVAKIEELEESHIIDPNVCPGCGGPLDDDRCFVSYDHVWCDVKGTGHEENLEFYK